MYERRLVVYVRGLVGDGERARDVVQEAFLKLCEQDRAALDGRLAAWLYAVCRNGALDVLRKERRMSTMTDSGLSEEVAGMIGGAQAEGSDPAGRAAARESLSRILALVEKLPPDQREAIRLRFQGGLSYRQISEVTGHSVSNVGFLLHRGLRTIREAMGEKTGQVTPRKRGQGES